MAGADDPARRLPGAAVLAGLGLVGVLGIALVAIGSGGALGPGSAPRSTATPSPDPSPSHALSGWPSPSPSVLPSPSPSVLPSVAPEDDPLLDGLLTAADLPGLSAPLGWLEGPGPFDIDDASFEADGGVRVVSQGWQSLADSGLAAVFDFRMQFPSDAAAVAYLDAAETVLSEAEATGQSPAPSPPAIGSDTRVYGLATTGEAGPVLLRTYLFRVGPVVAKIVAGGPGVEVATTDALARTAAERIAAAGRPVPGSPRPMVTPPPTPGASAPLPTGEALAALLLEHVPPAIAPGCVPDTQRVWVGELATLVCTDEASDVTVTYSGFDGAEAVEAAIDASLEGIDLSAVAASCDLGTFVGPYDVEDEEVGRVVCWAEQGGQAIMWSDDRLAILAVAVSPTLDAAGLYLWWLEAGPIA